MMVSKSIILIDTFYTDNIKISKDKKKIATCKSKLLTTTINT